MTTASLPPYSATIIGRGVRLEPLSMESLRELAPRLRRPEVFAGGHAGGPAAMPDTDEGYVEFFAAYSPMHRAGRSYVVRLDGGEDDGRAVGTTSLYDEVCATRSIAIGYTAYEPEVWGTFVNAATKRALLDTVFNGGFFRVEFHVAGGNERSRAAVSRLGAHLDGVLRDHRVLADGTLADTAIFSILSHEWPEVRDELDARIERGLPRPALGE